MKQRNTKASFQFSRERESNQDSLAEKSNLFNTRVKALSQSIGHLCKDILDNGYMVEYSA